MNYLVSEEFLKSDFVEKGDIANKGDIVGLNDPKSQVTRRHGNGEDFFLFLIERNGGFEYFFFELHLLQDGAFNELGQCELAGDGLQHIFFILNYYKSIFFSPELKIRPNSATSPFHYKLPIFFFTLTSPSVLFNKSWFCNCLGILYNKGMNIKNR